jgi:hypothetical protein
MYLRKTDFYNGLTCFLVRGGHAMTIGCKGQAFEIGHGAHEGLWQPKRTVNQ